MVINLLAACFFWLIPYLTGRIFTRGILSCFAVGSLFWFLTYFLVSWFVNFFQTGNFPTIIYALTVLVSTISIVKIIIQGQILRFQNKIPFLFLGILSTVVYFFIWRIQTPYPLQLDWDIYEHITLANKISTGHLSLLSSKISDTFTINSYPPLFHTLLSIPHIILRADFLGIYYYLEYFYFLLTVIATFILAKKIFQNNWVSLMAGIFSVFIFENFMVYTSLFLMPQNLAALLTIYAIIYVSKEKINKLLLGSMLLVIFFMHYVIGALAILIILSYILLQKRSLGILNWGILVSSAILLLLLILNYSGTNFVLTGREEAIHFTFPLIKKLGFLFDWFSLSLIFLPISYFTILKKGTKEQKAILILTLLTLGLSLAPWSYFLKFFVFDHYLINILLAAGLWMLILNLPKLIKILATIWISFSLMVVFYESQLAYKEPLLFENKYSHLSQSEIEASEWISKNYGNNTLLISDPGTQYILEAISGINSPGGAYMNIQTRQALSQINGSNSIAMIKEKLARIQDELSFERNQRKETIFILSGRYFAWQQLLPEQKLSFYYNIWKPYILSFQDSQYINSLIADPGLKVVYQNDELVIIQI